MTTTQIDPGWRISVGVSALGWRRIGLAFRVRWFADLSYLEPEAFDDPAAARFVTRLRGYRTPNAAIAAARLFALAEDKDEKWVLQA